MSATKAHRVKRGSVLILAIWTLSFLSLFAAYIGLRVRQRVALLSRLETRSQLHFIAESGIKLAIAALRDDLKRNYHQYTPYGKFYRHNNTDLYADIEIGKGKVDIFYNFVADNISASEIRFGIVDEESKININSANRETLIRLMRNVVTHTKDNIADLADAIIDWREFGQSQATGFYSDEYYANLQYPYEPTNEAYENFDEVLLTKGFDQNLWKQLKPFMTVYGDGIVNINTASRPVILAIGFSEPLTDKLLTVRRGLDGIEATVDDYVFIKNYDIASEILKFVKLEIDEMKEIDAANAQGKIKTNSFYYSIYSRARLREKDLTVQCVYNSNENKIEYWREKF